MAKFNLQLAIGDDHTTMRENSVSNLSKKFRFGSQAIFYVASQVTEEIFKIFGPICVDIPKQQEF